MRNGGTPALAEAEAEAEAVGLYLDELDDATRHVSSTPLVTSLALPAA